MTRHKRPSRPWRPLRSIYLIDAENVAGSARPGRVDFERARRRLDAAVDRDEHDHVVVAAGVSNALDAGLVWTEGQLLVGRGPDGAEVALLGWAQHAELAARFDAVVIASGDFAFVALAAALRLAGVPVIVAAWRASCSRSLARAATSVRWLDPTEPVTRRTAALTLEVPDAA